MSHHVDHLSNDWALCINPSFDLVGIAIKTLDNNEYRILKIDASGKSFEVRDLKELKYPIEYIPLPKCKSRLNLYMIIAYCALGVPRQLLSSLSQLVQSLPPPQNPQWALQWLLLAFIRSMGIRWKKEGDRYNELAGLDGYQEHALPTEIVSPLLLLKQYDRDAKISDLMAIVGTERPFGHKPDLGDFEFDLVQESARLINLYA